MGDVHNVENVDFDVIVGIPVENVDFDVIVGIPLWLRL